MLEKTKKIILATVAVAVVSYFDIRKSQSESDSLFDPCPPSPNCVSTEAESQAHYVPPFVLAVSTIDGWREVHRAVGRLPRTRIVQESGHYLRAECKSSFFRFVDDLELRLVESEGIIAVRSSSRVGYFDFGVNRKRVEKLRRDLTSGGIIK